MQRKPHRRKSSALAVIAATMLLTLLALLTPSPLRAQATAAARTDPATTLTDILAAACRLDETAFASHLTTVNAEAFRALPTPQRRALLKRFVLLEDPGKPLRSTTADGKIVLRCEAAGVNVEMRFGASQTQDNLAFIRVEVPQAGQTDQQLQNVRFGLVRESGDWKLISVGLLLLDIPALQRQWEQADADAEETSVLVAMRNIRVALKSYQAAYGMLPESLDQLGPAPGGGLSPDKAGLLDSDTASGENYGYRFRYTIVPPANPGDDAERDKAAGFTLAATPLEYGKTGKRSYYMDASGVLYGDDKHGAIATGQDQRITPQPDALPDAGTQP